MGRIARPTTPTPANTPRRTSTTTPRSDRSPARAKRSQTRDTQPKPASDPVPSSPPLQTTTATTPLNVSTFKRHSNPSPRTTARPRPKRAALNRRRASPDPDRVQHGPTARRDRVRHPRRRAPRPRARHPACSRRRAQARPHRADQAESSQQDMTRLPDTERARLPLGKRGALEGVARRHGRRRNPAWRPPRSSLRTLTNRPCHSPQPWHEKVGRSIKGSDTPQSLHRNDRSTIKSPAANTHGRRPR